MAIASVIVPAHDEEAVIERCLRSVLEGAATGELDVIVVANGCTDRTAEIAADVPGVRVITTDVAGKQHALNIGDAHAAAWPRIYLDADVITSIADVRATVDRLAAGDVLAAAPRLQVAMDGRPWAVRAYYRIYLKVPYTQSGMVGSGFYALSNEGHDRIGAFPDVMNDDTFVHQSFAPHERATVEDATFTVQAPHDLRSLIRTKARVATGIQQLRAMGLPPAPAERDPDDISHARPLPSTRSALLRSPRNWLDLPVYAAIYGTTRVLARWRLRRGDLSWTSDRTIRTQPAAAPTTRAPRTMTDHLLRLLRSVADPRTYLHGVKLLNFANYTHVVQRRRMRCGRGVRISPNASFRNGERIAIGDGTHVGERAMIWAGDSTGAVRIGDHCLLGPEVLLTASNYDVQPGTLTMEAPRREADITIGRNVWLGARAIVTAGVTIGDDCVIGAGAVVTKDVPSGSTAVGVPARIVRTTATGHADLGDADGAEERTSIVDIDAAQPGNDGAATTLHDEEQVR